MNYGLFLGKAKENISMKRVSGFFALISMLLFLQNCSSASPETHLYQRQWMLTEFQDYPREFLVKHRAQLDLAPAKNKPHFYRANMGCNEIFITAEFRRNGNVQFTDAGSTEMYCEETMKLEQDFLKALPSMKKFEINGHKLTLKDGEQGSMTFIAADWD